MFALQRQNFEEIELTTVKESSGRRAKVYAFGELVNLSEGKKVF
jgi:hypothetical protein